MDFFCFVSFFYYVAVVMPLTHLIQQNIIPLFHYIFFCCFVLGIHATSCSATWWCWSFVIYFSFKKFLKMIFVHTLWCSFFMLQVTINHVLMSCVFICSFVVLFLNKNSFLEISIRLVFFFFLCKSSHIIFRSCSVYEFSSCEEVIQYVNCLNKTIKN